jgi:hypothetical protein
MTIALEGQEFLSPFQGFAVGIGVRNQGLRAWLRHSTYPWLKTVGLPALEFRCDVFSKDPRITT